MNRALPQAGHGSGRNPRGGYILLEVLLSLVLVGVGLTGVMLALRAGLAASERSRHVTAATMLAQQKLAEFRSAPPQRIGTLNGDFGQEGPDYAWRAQISPMEEHDFYAVTVEVVWTRSGREQSVALNSLLGIQSP